MKHTKRGLAVLACALLITLACAPALADAPPVDFLPDALLGADGGFTLEKIPWNSDRETVEALLGTPLGARVHGDGDPDAGHGKYCPAAEVFMPTLDAPIEATQGKQRLSVFFNDGALRSVYTSVYATDEGASDETLDAIVSAYEAALGAADIRTEHTEALEGGRSLHMLHRIWMGSDAVNGEVSYLDVTDCLESHGRVLRIIVGTTAATNLWAE